MCVMFHHLSSAWSDISRTGKKTDLHLREESRMCEHMIDVIAL